MTSRIPLFAVTVEETSAPAQEQHGKKTKSMSDQTREKATIFVGGLDSQVTAETLHDAFIPFGEIADVTLPKPEL